MLVFLLLDLNEVNADSVNVAQIHFPVSNTSYNGNMFSTTVSIITKKVLFRVFYFPLIAAANAQEGIRVKSHFRIDVPLYICCVFSEQLFKRTPQEGCFCKCF